MKNKIAAAIIGPGNIGTDLLKKAMRSTKIQPKWMVGVDDASPGLKYARQLGLKTTSSGVDGFLTGIQEDDIRIVFDATSANAHQENFWKVSGKGVVMIDMTPAAIGPYCIPTVNIQEVVAAHDLNVNMVTCGGQATIPLVAAVSRVQPVKYAEIVATIASKSAGPGTRANIDEFTRTTADAITTLGGAQEGKAIIIINPAEPPLVMRDTIHCLTVDLPDEKLIVRSIMEMIEKIQEYVPGYALKNGPVFDNKRVTIFVEVEGMGDHLPKYSGNLDIMTAAALHTAEMYAVEILAGRFLHDGVSSLKRGRG